MSGTIGGFAYQDLNQNGVFDAAEPGIGGVGLQLSGAATSSVSTAANDDYAFANLAAGDYSVAAPVSTAQFHLFTPSPLFVGVAPGMVVPHVDFGYVAVCPAPPSANKSNFNGTPIAAGNVRVPGACELMLPASRRRGLVEDVSNSALEAGDDVLQVEKLVSPQRSRRR